MQDNTVAVRMHSSTKTALDAKVVEINSARSEKGMAPLTKAQVISIAINNLKVSHGVAK